MSDKAPLCRSNAKRVLHVGYPLRVGEVDESGQYRRTVYFDPADLDGAFEIPFLVVAEYGDGMLLRRFEMFDIDQLDEARARFAEVAGDSDPVPSHKETVRPNLASEAMRRWIETYECGRDTGDWQPMCEVCDETF